MVLRIFDCENIMIKLTNQKTETDPIETQMFQTALNIYKRNE